MIVVDSSVWIDYFNGVETRETALFKFPYLGMRIECKVRHGVSSMKSIRTSLRDRPCLANALIAQLGLTRQLKKLGNYTK